MIDLCVDLYDWTKFRSAKGGAVKLHLVLDHDDYPPARTPRLAAID